MKQWIYVLAIVATNPVTHVVEHGPEDIRYESAVVTAEDYNGAIVAGWHDMEARGIMPIRTPGECANDHAIEVPTPA